MLSEIKLQRELNVPLPLGSQDLAEGQAGHVIVRRVEMRRIRQVEEFGAELEPLRLDRYRLLQRQIEVPQTCSANHPDSRVAQCLRHWLLKIGDVDPPC